MTRSARGLLVSFSVMALFACASAGGASAGGPAGEASGPDSGGTGGTGADAAVLQEDGGQRPNVIWLQNVWGCEAFAPKELFVRSWSVGDAGRGLFAINAAGTGVLQYARPNGSGWAARIERDGGMRDVAEGAPRFITETGTVFLADGRGGRLYFLDGGMLRMTVPARVFAVNDSVVAGTDEERAVVVHTGQLPVTLPTVHFGGRSSPFFPLGSDTDGGRFVGYTGAGNGGGTLPLLYDQSGYRVLSAIDGVAVDVEGELAWGVASNRFLVAWCQSGGVVASAPFEAVTAARAFSAGGVIVANYYRGSGGDDVVVWGGRSGELLSLSKALALARMIHGAGN
jgi:hypothetical protein